MLPRINRTRHLNRYREIVLTFARYGFGEFISRFNILEWISLKKRDIDQDLEPSTQALSTAERFREALDNLGPTFIKLGQVLSTRPDIMPPAFINELQKLQDSAKPLEWPDIRQVVEEELGGSIYQFFRFVESMPIATASLAQVHKGRLLDGTDVVLKVQRPGIQKQIDIDLEILWDAARLVQSFTALGRVYDLPSIVEEFAYTLNTELDYEMEGQHADFFRENFADDPDVYIPAIYWDYSTPRLLVMELLRGIKINDVERLEARGYDRHLLALKSARLIIKEVLEDGFFHADPHPGNLYVMEGEVIGVMDFGMVGWLDTRLRTQIAQLYISTVRRDIDGMVDRLIQLGVAGYDVNRKQLRRDLTRLIRKYYGRSLKNIRARDMAQDIMPIIFRHQLQVPTDLWLLLKTLVIMEGVGLKLDPDFDIFEASQPFVRRLTRNLWSAKGLRQALIRTSANLSDLMMTTPELGLGLLRRLDQGQLKLQIEPSGLEDLFVRIDRVINRLTVSILLSALILGLAMVIPNLGGGATWITIAAILMFMSVTSLAFWIAISIISGSNR